MIKELPYIESTVGWQFLEEVVCHGLYYYRILWSNINQLVILEVSIGIGQCKYVKV